MQGHRKSFAIKSTPAVVTYTYSLCILAVKFSCNACISMVRLSVTFIIIKMSYDSIFFAELHRVSIVSWGSCIGRGVVLCRVCPCCDGSGNASARGAEQCGNDGTRLRHAHVRPRVRRGECIGPGVFSGHWIEKGTFYFLVLTVEKLYLQKSPTHLNAYVTAKMLI